MPRDAQPTVDMIAEVGIEERARSYPHPPDLPDWLLQHLWRGAFEAWQAGAEEFALKPTTILAMASMARRAIREQKKP